MTQLFANEYLFYSIAAVITTALSFCVSKIPAFQNSSFSKNLPLVFGKSISIHVIIASVFMLIRTSIVDGIDSLMLNLHNVLLQGMSIAGLAMLLENLVKVLFSREYSANVKIINSEKLSHISEVLTANYAGFSRLNWLQKLGIVTVIDVDLDNVFKSDGEKEAKPNYYKLFKDILSEYINVDHLSEKIYELYSIYKSDKQFEIKESVSS